MLGPMDVLLEDERLPSVALPAELHRLYGGDLGFTEPRVYANFVATLDGIVAIPSIPSSNSLIGMESKADHFVMGLLRAFADIVLIGAGVLRASPTGTWLPEKVYPPAAEAFAELRHDLGKTDAPEVAVLTGSGAIDPSHPVFEAGAVVLTSAPGAERLAGQLPAAGSIIVLGDDTTIDGRRVVEALLERGHRLILSEAGPHAFGSLVAAQAVDELFLTVSPLLVGGGEDRYRLVESTGPLPGVRGRLTSLRQSGEHVFLRYDLRHGAA
jgi:riboflavin biosynthesis pyrimidine reductase